jgi:hypothetical protein
MKFIEFLATAFIRVFGITEPKPAQLRAASWFIVGLLVLVLIVVAVAGVTLHSLLYH